jgi:D-alanyl-D-alanine carboxypeptidase (penicillin-binding protein 5/6)
MRLISVVMGSPSVKAREEAAGAASWLATFYETWRARRWSGFCRVYKSASEHRRAPCRPTSTPPPGGQGGSPATAIHRRREPLIAPLAAGKPVGELTVTDASGAVIARAPLVPLAAVPLGGLWTRTLDSIALWFH